MRWEWLVSKSRLRYTICGCSAPRLKYRSRADMPLLFPLLRRLRMNLKWCVPKLIDSRFMCGCPAPCLKYQHVLYMCWSRDHGESNMIVSETMKRTYDVWPFCALSQVSARHTDASSLFRSAKGHDQTGMVFSKAYG
jgi:hypothetical protein